MGLENQQVEFLNASDLGFEVVAKLTFFYGPYP
jgi:hypothetical protein